MKKVLIISYFFPPCTLTAAQRAGSWVSYLHQFGYYPIVVTRKWERPIKTYRDMSFPTSDGIQHEKHDTHEVYYIPYQGNLRDRIYAKHESRNAILRKALTLFELLFQNFTLSVVPFRGMYDQAKALLASDKDIQKMVISGGPFIQFRFGYMLSRIFGVKWIGDYRDAWSTSDVIRAEKGKSFEGVLAFDRLFERKWLKTASHITSVSPPLAESISAVSDRPHETLYNGFEPKDFAGMEQEAENPVFTITYVGTLYEGQKAEIFLDAFKQFLDQSGAKDVMVKFPGLAIVPEQSQRVMKLMKGYEDYIICTERIPREEVLKIQASSHMLLYFAWQGFKGIVGSKVYEYMATGIPILVAPGDGSTVDDIMRSSGAGLVLGQENEIVQHIHNSYKTFKEGKFKKNDVNSSSILAFTRQKQAETLATLLDRL